GTGSTGSTCAAWSRRFADRRSGSRAWAGAWTTTPATSWPPRRQAASPPGSPTRPAEAGASLGLGEEHVDDHDQRVGLVDLGVVVAVGVAVTTGRDHDQEPAADGLTRDPLGHAPQKPADLVRGRLAAVGLLEHPASPGLPAVVEGDRVGARHLAPGAP